MSKLKEYLRKHEYLFIRLNLKNFESLHKELVYIQGEDLIKAALHFNNEIYITSLTSYNVKRRIDPNWETNYLVINIKSDKDINKLHGFLASGLSFEDYIEIKLKSLGY